MSELLLPIVMLSLFNSQIAATGPQVVETEATALEGNLETSYLLEQVSKCVLFGCHVVLMQTRSTAFVVPSDTSAEKILISRARTFSRDQGIAHLFPTSRGRQHQSWIVLRLLIPNLTLIVLDDATNPE